MYVNISEKEFNYLFDAIDKHEEIIKQLCMRYNIKKIDDGLVKPKYEYGKPIKCINIAYMHFKLDQHEKQLQDLINERIEYKMNSGDEYKEVGLTKEQKRYLMTKIEEQDYNIERLCEASLPDDNFDENIESRLPILFCLTIVILLVFIVSYKILTIK